MHKSANTYSMYIHSLTRKNLNHENKKNIKNLIYVHVAKRNQYHVVKHSFSRINTFHYCIKHSLKHDFLHAATCL